MLEAIPLQVNRTRLLCILRLVLDLVYLLVRVQVSGGNQPGARPERNVGNAVVCTRVREPVLDSRRPARPRAAGRRGVGPVEDAPRGAQGDRRYVCLLS